MDLLYNGEKASQLNPTPYEIKPSVPGIDYLFMRDSK